jgi:hypothetical protein
VKTVWKYLIPLGDVKELDLPEGAEPLSVERQADGYYLWVLLDPTKPLVRRRFRLVGTGHELPDSFQKAHFIGTIFPFGGQAVFHLFEWPEEE